MQTIAATVFCLVNAETDMVHRYHCAGDANLEKPAPWRLIFSIINDAQKSLRQLHAGQINDGNRASRDQLPGAEFIAQQESGMATSVTIISDSGARRGNRLATIVGLRNDFDVTRGLRQALQAGAQNRMIKRNYLPDHHK